jgi:hypothetical protein
MNHDLGTSSPFPYYVNEISQVELIKQIPIRRAISRDSQRAVATGTYHPHPFWKLKPKYQIQLPIILNFRFELTHCAGVKAYILEHDEKEKETPGSKIPDSSLSIEI